MYVIPKFLTTSTDPSNHLTVPEGKMWKVLTPILDNSMFKAENANGDVFNVHTLSLSTFNGSTYSPFFDVYVPEGYKLYSLNPSLQPIASQIHILEIDL